MKVGIITQPLKGNYGGILQNYALQKILVRMGHEPITIDFLWSRNLFAYLKSTLKSLLLFPFPNKRRAFIKLHDKRSNPDIDSFVRKHIKTTKQVYRYKPSVINRYNLDALITGSDQVWRPKYNPYLKDMYLNFAKNKNILKFAYGASFGTSDKEYTDEEISECIGAVRKLSSVSVRESSGVSLCSDYYSIEAQEVLDPTLLLTVNDYYELSENIPKTNEKYIGVYVLDKNPYILKIINNICHQIGIDNIISTTENTHGISPEKWLALFRDAEFIVTDSFHGTVFSIIFQKPFISIYNISRGGDRFESLLKPLGLIERLVINNQPVTENLFSNTIDWYTVDSELDKRRLLSFNFIKSSFDKIYK